MDYFNDFLSRVLNVISEFLFIFNRTLFKIGDSAYGLQFHIESTKEMTERWINEDILFIDNGLGPKGQEILREEDKQYGEKTIIKRKLLINKLFNLLSKH